jgi:hypothetical protein
MIAQFSIILIIVGFILSVYAGVVLSLSNKMQSSDGQLSQPKIITFTVIMTIAVLMVMAGVLGYYWLRGNVPYYFN